MLEARKLCVRAGNFSLDNISVTVASSSCHVIVGPTGSGKSLLLESVTGLRKPESGRIFLDGEEITHLPVEKRKLSYVPQDLALFPHMTVRENIYYPVRMKGRKNSHRNDMVEELVEHLGIQPLWDRSIRNLSGGERQRIALARAVASGSRYLALDEPLSALHESLKRQLWPVLKMLQTHYDLGILTVTHDLDEAFFLADSISIVLDGKLRQQGPKETVYERPADLEVAEFLGIRNLFASTAVAMNDKSIVASCEDLNTTLTVRSDKNCPIHAGSPPFYVGIRSEDVKVVMSSDPGTHTTNLIRGTIKDTFVTGALFTLMVSVTNSSRLIEACVLRSTIRDTPVSPGDVVSVILPEESLFAVTHFQGKTPDI